MPKKRKHEESSPTEPVHRAEIDDASSSTKNSKKRKYERAAAVSEPSQSGQAMGEAPEPAKKSKERKRAEADTTKRQQPSSPQSVIHALEVSTKPKKSETSGPAPTQPTSEQAQESQSTSANPESKPSGAVRQAKSERRSKKKTREDHLRIKREKQEARLARDAERKRQRLEAQAAKEARKTAASNPPIDALANGSDFVSLFAEDTTATPIDITGAPAIPPKPIHEPKRSKKGTTKVERREARLAHQQMQKEKTAIKKAKKLRKLSQHSLDTIPESKPPPPPIDPTTGASKNNRFILFVGNLPFSTTTEALTTHFSSLQPFTIRHSTSKETGKSKGFAFLEFENYDRMKTCLQLYHHSYFNPDAPSSSIPTPEDDLEPQNRDVPKIRGDGKDRGRRINVELTAGGGGKGKERKEKIKTKNKKLSEQRERRVQKEKEQKAVERAEKAVQGPATGVNADVGVKEDSRGDIHPSRMSLVKG